MPLVRHRIEVCVGDSLQDAWALVCRYDATDEHPDLRRSDWWVLRIKGGLVIDAWGTRTPLGGLAWRDDGVLCTTALREFVSRRLREKNALWQFSDADGVITVAHSPPTDPLLNETETLRDGTWVAYARFIASSAALYLYDGSVLTPMPPAPFKQCAIHGLGPSFLVAGSYDGAVAFGSATRGWDAPQKLTPGLVNAVFAAAPDEVYASVSFPHSVVRWDGSRWSEFARFDTNALALCVRGDELLALLDEERGIVRFGRHDSRPRGTPVAVRGADSLRRARFHVGPAAVLVTENEGVTEITDGAITGRFELATAVARIAHHEPLWQTAQIDLDPSRFDAPPLREDSPREPERLAWSLCVGASLDDAHFLAVRSADVERPAPSERESVVGHIVKGAIREVTVVAPILEGLQRTPSGRVWAAAWSDQGGVWRTATDGSLATWERFEDVPPMQGLFVLHDECALAWGGYGRAQRFYLFDGRAFRAIPAPPGRVTAAHGCAPDWVVVVGLGGLVARWDGSAWHRWPLAATGMLGSVHVVSPDEMYATGPAGAVFEGTRHGWVERAPVEGVAVGVTKWRDGVFVGDPLQGLLRVEGARTVPLDLPVFPANLHAGRDALVMIERDGVAETRDLKRLRRVDNADLEVALRDFEPTWG